MYPSIWIFTDLTMKYVTELKQDVFHKMVDQIFHYDYGSNHIDTFVSHCVLHSPISGN